MRGIGCLLLIVVFFQGISLGQTSKKKNEFHPPITKQELKLDSIIKLTDVNMFWFLTKSPGYKWSDSYRLLFTPALTRAIVVENEKLIEAAGGYEEGYINGFDCSPITCAQDVFDHYLYRTIMQNDSRAIIEYAWPKSEFRKEITTTATYRMVKKNSVWLLDGVSCGEYLNFNMDHMKSLKKSNKSKF